MTINKGTEHLGNHPKKLRKAAQQALNAAKLLEKQQIAAGAKWAQGANRSWCLIK